MKLKPGVKLVDETSGAFLLDTRKGVYWHLNPSGMRLISALSEGRSVEDVVGEVAAEFSVDPDIVRADCMALLKELGRARLIEKTS
ncbi:PqqD family peptide modification chaperone [Nonomuraea sp. NPDC049714]|uniref:PqqD family peptide modification chaperone n=1 Tax=Nonomuraea sp. NPDC049714 TaxID=3364357 RepID=UPI003792AFB1